MADALALMERVRFLEERGKDLLKSTTTDDVPMRRALSSVNLLNDSFRNGNESSAENFAEFSSMTEEKRRPITSSMSLLPPLPLSTSRRLFRSSASLNRQFGELQLSPKSIAISDIQHKQPGVDAIRLQHELTQLAHERDEERSKLSNALAHLKCSSEQTKAEFERRLLDKEESLSKLECSLDQCNKRMLHMEEELSVASETLSSQEREMDKLRSDLSTYNNFANQVRTLLSEYSERVSVFNESNDNVMSVPPLPPASCQSVGALIHSLSSCMRSAWEHSLTVRTKCERLTSDVTNIKMECAKAIERSEAERARGISAIQAEAEHALKLGQQRLSTAQDRLRVLEEQFDLTRDDLNQQIAFRDAKIEELRSNIAHVREQCENERGDAIKRATDAERLLAESEVNRLRSVAMATDADARSRQLEIELDDMKRRFASLEGDLVGEHEKLCKIWQADDVRSSRIKDAESREAMLKKRICELESDLEANINEFQAAIVDLKSKNECSEKELNIARDRIGELTRELEASLEYMSRCQEEMEYAKKRVVDGDMIKQESLKDREHLKLELDSLRVKFKEMDSEHHRIVTELHEIRSERDQLRKDSIASRLSATESVKSAQMLAKRNKELENQTKQENEALRQEVDKLLRNLKEQEGRLAALAAEKKQLEAVSGCHQTEQLTAMRALAKKLAYTEHQLILTQRMSSGDNSCANGDGSVAASKLKAVEDRLRDALDDGNEAKLRAAEQEKRANEAVRIVEKLRRKLDSEKTRVSLLHREAAKFHAEANKNRSQLEATVAYVGNLEKELAKRSKGNFPMLPDRFATINNDHEKDSARRKKSKSLSFILFYVINCYGKYFDGL